MTEDKKILHQINDLRDFAEQIGFDRVVLELEQVLKAYAEDLRLLAEANDDPTIGLDTRPDPGKYNA